MDTILVRGNGPLNGEIPIAGAKNACLTLMPATLLTDEPLTLTNAPRLSDIRTVESHPIALAQCEQTLKTLHMTVIEHFDTAVAARDVAEAGDPTRAAIAAVGAAEVYGLSILRNDLQDSSDNRTRFVLLSASEG